MLKKLKMKRYYNNKNNKNEFKKFRILVNNKAI